MAEEISAGKISIDFSADLSDLHQAFAEAKKGLNDLSGSMTKGTGAMSDFGQAGQVAGGILIAEVVKGAVEAAHAIGRFAFVVTKSAGEAVEALETVAGQTGLTIQQLQELEPVFARSGMSAQAMGGVFRILSRNMEQAKDPTSQATKSFRELGINISGLETPTEVFTLIAERISKLPDGFQKTRLETELLGRSGTRLNGVLSQGAEGLRRSAAEARAMGNVLSTEANSALLKVNDSFDDLDVAQANLEKHLGVLFAPFIQGLNEARKLTIDFATKAIDQVIVATRTLHARFMGLWGFLVEAASLSITEWGKLPEIWAKWNKQTEDEVAKIRTLGVTAKETADSVGKINKEAQAAGAAMVAAANKSSMALVQNKMGWEIVEKALTRYRLVQKGVIDAGDAEVTHWTSLTASMQAMAAAADKASVAAGTMSPVEFAQGNSDRATAGIVAQQVAEKKHLQSTLDGLASEQSAHQRNTNEWLALQQKKDEASKASYAKMTVLDAQLNTAIIAGQSEVQTAQQRTNELELSAAVSVANSNLKILESQFASTDQLRAGRLSVIQMQLEQELNAVGLTEAQKVAIIRKSEAEKMGVARQYPTFIEGQLQQLVASNVFSLAQITTAWTSGLANSIVNGGNFAKAAMQQTQIALIQGALNFGVQKAALLAQQYLVEIGWATTTATSVAGINAAKNATIIAGETGTAVATTSIWAGASAAIVGMFAVTGTAIKLFFVETILPMMISIGTAIMEFLSAVAEGMATTIFGIPLAVGIAVAVVGIGVAIAGLAGAFAKGGIVTGPTLGLMGEAGSPEAAIPLNERGAKFMAQTMGLSQGSRAGGGTTSQTIIVELNGSPIMRMVADNLPSMLRLKGLPA